MARSYLPLGRALVVLAAPAIALGSPRGPHVSLRVCGAISPSSDPNQVELLAVLQDTLPPPCAGAISVINHWYGRDDIPIGAYKGSGLSLVGDALEHACEWHGPQRSHLSVLHLRTRRAPRR